jgi:hypothetical protein
MHEILIVHLSNDKSINGAGTFDSFINGFLLNTVGIERIILPRYTIEWRFYGLHDVLGRMGYGGLISAS